jgi:hypothetical protein
VIVAIILTISSLEEYKSSGTNEGKVFFLGGVFWLFT